MANCTVRGNKTTKELKKGVSIMKKSCFKVLCMVLIIALLAPNAFAATPTPEALLDNTVINPKQEKIDALFTELNELAAEKSMLTAENNDNLSTASLQTITRMNAIHERKAELNAELEQLGVNEIDPSNAADMKQLEEVMAASLLAYSDRSGYPPPNLSEYAQVYTIHQITDQTVVNGVSYNYSYITVTDDKGYLASPLHVKSFNNVMIRRGSLTFDEIASEVFEFGTDHLIGRLPWYYSWGLETVFTSLTGVPGYASVTSYNNRDIYILDIIAKTQMAYTYVEIPNSGWILCGVKAPNITFNRYDHLNATINGEDILESETSVSSVSTGVPPNAYVGNYVLGGNMVVHDYGYYTVEGRLGAFCGAQRQLVR